MYLYKTIYEFLMVSYSDQQALNQKYLQAKPPPTLRPKLWVFRSLGEDQGYWIEQQTKEISKVYPFLKAIRKSVEEIKVRNNVLEQYVQQSDEQEVKALKKVENYMKIKTYSIAYMEKLISNQDSETQKGGEPQPVEGEQQNQLNQAQEQLKSENQDFLDEVIQDLEIEEQISKEKLLEWMFSWPYSLNTEFFDLQKQIEEKIQEDLNLIREKENNRKQAMERMIKKINIVNRLGKQFAKTNVTYFRDQLAQKKQEEDLLQKIKNTKAVIGVSDIRIKKKLRQLLGKAMQDDSEKNKLRELEELEKQIVAASQEKQKKKKKQMQDQLKKKLKQQLGLGDESSGDDEDEMMEDDELPESDHEQFVDVSFSSESEDKLGKNPDDEPEDDSFTFKNVIQTKSEEDKVSENYMSNKESHAPYVEDLDAHLERKDSQKSKNTNHQNMKIIQQEQMIQLMGKGESLEQRRSRFMNQFIQNKLHELRDSSTFIKKIRKKLKYMNISKTTDDLKKKIISLKMMQLRVNQENQLLSNQHNSEESIDFLKEILTFQNSQSSSEESDDESDISQIQKISEVGSQFEISQDEDQLAKMMKDAPPLSLNLQMSEMGDDFYSKGFPEVKDLEQELKENQSPKSTSNNSNKRKSFAKRRNSSSEELVLRGSFHLTRPILAKQDSLLQRQTSSELNIIDEQDNKSDESKENQGKPLSVIESAANKSDGSEPKEGDLKSSRSISVPNSISASPVELDYQELALANKEEKISQFKHVDLPYAPSKRPLHLTKELERVEEESYSTTPKIMLSPVKSQALSVRDDKSSQNRLILSKRASQQSEIEQFLKFADDTSSRKNSLKTEIISAQRSPSIHSPHNIQENQAAKTKDEYNIFLEKIKVFDDSHPEINEELLTQNDKIVLRYFEKAIGDPRLKKSELFLSSKYHQSLNIDSILFAAQKLKIKVLAQRETDLLWIAQEYLIHPIPQDLLLQMNLARQESNADNHFEKLKQHYFHQLVVQHRKKRVEFIEKSIQNDDELNTYMKSNSWGVIYEKGEFLNYNFFTKAKEQLNQIQQNSQAGLRKQNSIQANIIEQLKPVQLLQRKQTGNEAQSSISKIHSDLINSRISRLNSNTLPNILIATSDSPIPFQPSSATTKPDEKESDFNLHAFKEHFVFDFKAFPQVKTEKMKQDIPKPILTIKSIQGQISQPNQVRKMGSTSNILQSSDVLSTLNYERSGTFKGVRPYTYQSIGSTIQVQEMNEILEVNESKEEQKIAQERAASSERSHYRTSRRTDSFASEVKTKQIKRIIFNNNLETQTRLYQQQYEDLLNSRQSQANHFQSQTVDSRQPYFCPKYMDQHLSLTSRLTPMQDMNQTLQSSSNFNHRIFRNMQNNIKLNSYSYLTQQKYQEQLDQEKANLLIQRQQVGEQSSFAHNMAGSMPFHYYKVLLNTQSKKDLMQEAQKKRVIDVTQAKRFSSMGSRQSLAQGPMTTRDYHNKNDFRNMSPKSLQRWAMHSELNLDLAQSIGLISRRTGNSSYSRLRRTQDAKMVFSQI